MRRVPVCRAAVTKPNTRENRQKEGDSLMKGLRKIFAAVWLAGIFCFLYRIPVQATELGLYGFIQQEEGVRWMNYDGTWLKDSWLDVFGLKYHLDKDGYIQVGMTIIDGKTYYLYPEGTMATGWLQLPDGLYFFNADGTMAVNTTVGNYEIGSDGKAASNSPLAQVVNTAIAAVTTPEMTNDEKLRACYQYIIDTCSYKRSYETPSGDWTGTYALEILTTGQGNCYRYAAGFAYLAKGLGYDVRVVTGTIKAARGGVTPHGWVEIRMGDAWYIFDAEMQDAKEYDLYKKTYKSYPVKPLNRGNEWSVSF